MTTAAWSSLASTPVEDPGPPRPPTSTRRLEVSSGNVVSTAPAQHHGAAHTAPAAPPMDSAAIKMDSSAMKGGANMYTGMMKTDSAAMKTTP